MPSWTKEQEAAINFDNSNIIVSAGAGSGKTAVLTARVIRKLKHGVDIDKLLVLTFTNEAANEMKERIRSSIKKEETLKKQLDFIDQAYITTFDSYALSIVKKYHYLLNISKNISIVESSIVNILKKTYLEEIIFRKYEEKDSDFLKLVGDFCTKNDDKIYDLILNISSRLDLRYDKKAYLTNYIANYFNDSYFAFLLDEYLKLLKNNIGMINQLLDSIQVKMDGKVYEKYYLALESLLNADTYSQVKESCNISLPIVRNTKEIEYEKEEIKNILKQLQDFTFFEDEKQIKNIYFSTLSYVKAIIDIIIELDEKVDKFKYDKESFEFTDVAKMAISIVKNNDEVRAELKNYYNEIMVDEYQDTNDLQEIFIGLISNNNVYMVGDIKQSIYRFRNANPTIFKSKYENYSLNNGGIKIDLLKNFRSRKEVLANINVLFDKIMDSFIGGADYKVSHRMVFGNENYNINGSNNINHNLEIYNYSMEDKTYSKAEKEIFIIANDIKQKINSAYTVLDKQSNCLRPITYSDFCIILDRGKEFGRYKKIFEYLGIPLAVYEDEKLTVELDVFVIKNLFSMILSLANKVSIKDKKFLYCYVSVARSFLFNYDDNDIFKAVNSLDYLKTTSLYQKCLSISNNVNKCSPVMLLDLIVKEFDYYDKLITAFDIDKAIIRLDYLKKIALNLEQLGYTNKMFLDYLDFMVNDENSDIKYKVNTRSGDCVKIMNIHKSKGLEFPVCYFGGFYEKFNDHDLKVRFLYDDSYGIITPYVRDGIGSFINKYLFINKYYIDEISEKIRLFYVAVTRAKEKMIIVCSLDEEDTVPISMVDDIKRLKYRSFLDMINSIKVDLLDYVVDINLNDVVMSKDYNKIKKFNYKEFIAPTKEKIVLSTNVVDNFAKQTKHFSKNSFSLISVDDKKNMEKGTYLHEIFEREDFLNPVNSYVKSFLNHNELKDINSAKIYKEYEFMYDDDNVTYHGIIDLMLVYSDRVLIIDYKMYHTVDDAYKKQLNGYKVYIEKKLNKVVKTYLYAIIPDKLEEIK